MVIEIEIEDAPRNGDEAVVRVHGEIPETHGEKQRGTERERETEAGIKTEVDTEEGDVLVALQRRKGEEMMAATLDPVQTGLGVPEKEEEVFE